MDLQTELQYEKMEDLNEEEINTNLNSNSNIISTETQIIPVNSEIRSNE